MKRQAALFFVLALFVFTPSLVVGQGPDLVAALKATPGCLGVDTARTGSGKQVIFAWFENRDAVLKWYYSDAHMALMQRLGGGTSAVRPRGPLADVPATGPILAVASLTPSATAAPSTLVSGFTQIAIELYAPLPGGLAAGGRFAPASLTVPGLIDIPMPTAPQPRR